MRKALAEVKHAREIHESQLVRLSSKRSRIALQEKYHAERQLDDIALNGKSKTLTAQEKERINRAIAVASVCEQEYNMITNKV